MFDLNFIDHYIKISLIPIFTYEEILVMYWTTLFTSCAMINYREVHEDVNRYINVWIKNFTKWRLIISKTLQLKSPI